MTLKEHAVTYADLGLVVFPVNPQTKQPRGGVSQYDATTDLDQVEAWWDKWPDSLIGHLPDEDVLLLDIDPRHNGKATWVRLKEEFEVPKTRLHYSGRGDGGGHIWFKRPEGKLTERKLDQWARERSLGSDRGGGRWAGGIDILQHRHRYTILPPSPHPETGKPYRWAQGRGLQAQVAEMPAELAELLKADPPEERPNGQIHWIEPDSIADWWSDNHGFSPLLRSKGWVCTSGDGEADGSAWRHPEASGDVSATIRHGTLFVYSTSTPFEPTEPGSPNGYTPFRAYAVLEHDGNLEAAASAARKVWQGINRAQRVPDIPTEWSKADDNGSHPPGAAIVPIHDDERIWTTRRSLSHIRDFARARQCSPWALLGVMLTRVAAATPPFVTLPPLVGSHLSLNTYVVLVGGSGSGKDAAISAGVDVLDDRSGVSYNTIGLGSGEGLLDQYVLMRPPKPKDDDPGGLEQHTTSVLFVNPEIETVLALKNRSGATLLPELRNAWTGKRLGFAYANKERRLTVPSHKYRLGLILGAQPEHAGVLLDDESAGTPQRFLWFPTADRKAPDNPPDDPGPLEWHLPSWPAAHNGRVTMEICEEAVASIRSARLKRLRGEDGEGLDGHALACREKTAALLAILDGRPSIEVTDWVLAGIVQDVSDAERSRVTQVMSHERAVQNRKRGEAQGHQTLVAGSVVEENEIGKVVRNLTTIQFVKQDDWSKSELKQKIRVDRRQYFEEALERLEQTQQIEQYQDGKVTRIKML